MVMSYPSRCSRHTVSISSRLSELASSTSPCFSQRNAVRPQFGLLWVGGVCYCLVSYENQEFLCG